MLVGRSAHELDLRLRDPAELELIDHIVLWNVLLGALHLVADLVGRLLLGSERNQGPRHLVYRVVIDLFVGGNAEKRALAFDLALARRVERVLYRVEGHRRIEFEAVLDLEAAEVVELGKARLG